MTQEMKDEDDNGKSKGKWQQPKDMGNNNKYKINRISMNSLATIWCKQQSESLKDKNQKFSGEQQRT